MMENLQQVTDMMGREISLVQRPLRIVSLVPSQTELLYDLGLNNEIVGITKFCVHPESWFRTKTRVGGTKQVHYDKIAALQPDLILANKEENTQEIVDTLAADYPVWVSDIHNLQDALEMIRQVGSLTGKTAAAEAIAHNIGTGFQQLAAKLHDDEQPVPVAYFIWRNPWMTAGSDTFISNMLSLLNWKNVFDDKRRYPEIAPEELAARKPRKILLSSEPYPFKEKHVEEIKAVLPDAEVLLVDGEMFSWYGSRLLKAPDYFASLL